MLIVYFSSTTENTHHFVHKLGLPSARIPIKKLTNPSPSPNHTSSSAPHTVVA